ncbi:probable WRKY transcription factor 32 [Olea europaea var. sylvestris]|uniref:probable WRKY transcription factor 32 n=1 Tax=Olea europaea var. sylvestris TaxID=158386 RepID=UPI000C1D2655|nr:probable WRKY transcription factor 32 [Olea europaea var. sylvestris]
MEISKQNKEEEICKEKIEKDENQTELSSNNSCNGTVENALIGRGGESQASQSGTISSSVPLVESDLQADFSASSHLLSEIPIKYSLQPLHSVEDLKDQLSLVPEEPLIGITSQSAQVQAQSPRQDPGGSAKLEVSPTSITQSISSILSPTLPEQKLSQVGNGSNPCIAEQDKQNHLDPKPLSSVPMLKTPSDGYNWRKYGQKQVKSPEGSRSYYRCTFSDCNAKKIECCNHSNHVIETVYRSHHNHDPPQKVNCIMEKPALSVVPANGSNNIALAGGGVSDVLSSSKEPLLEKIQVPETKQQDSSDSDETMEVNGSEEHVDKPELKKRLKKNPADDSGSFSKPGKKPKFIVHAAGDVGISGDGYRWRKYGQKMVKGNPHPRNYYKCTSAGCPVRKHIERAVDNTIAVIITYKGEHDHDMPVPRKRHGPTSSPLVTAVSRASVHNLHINKTEPHLSQTTQWSVDKEGELTGEALNLGGDNTVKLAPALLSIGFEIKPC